MIKRILRTGLGVIFFFVFLGFLLVSAVKFRVLSPVFWKTALEKGEVYQLLESQTVKLRLDLEMSAKKQAGGAISPEMAKILTPILSLDKVLTRDRFRELIETNLDRIFGYLEEKNRDLLVYLPVQEWNLPVANLGLPALAKFSAETPLEDVLPVLGMKSNQIELVTKELGQVKTVLSYLVLIWVILLLLVVGIGVGHYFLGIGLGDRVVGTGWLLLISGLVAKLIGTGAGRFFELATANSNQPFPVWGIGLGRSLIGQFFDLGATIGLVVGIVGLISILVMTVVSKQKKIKEEKVGLAKRIIVFFLGATLGFLVLGGMVAGVVVALGGKVDFSIQGSSETGRLSDDIYRSDKGWQIQFPAGWEIKKGEKTEGAIKKPVNGVTDWAAIEIGSWPRKEVVDSGNYLKLFKEAFASGKSGLENGKLVEGPYLETQEELGWKRFVFIIEFDGVVSGKKMRQRMYRYEYYPMENGDGFAITAKFPVESVAKFEAIVKRSVDTFGVSSN